MPGTENLINYGSAQILPKPASYLPLIEQLQQQKQQKFARDKYEQAKKEQDQKELYGLVGDTLNLKDFNPIIHDKVRKAQVELAQKIKAEKPSYADTYLMAQNKAAELGLTSQSYNHADQVIAANKKEFEGDKDLNLANVEAIARKYVKDAVEKGQYDPNKNYFTEAMRDNPNLALTSGGSTPKFNFQEEELLPDVRLKGSFKDINARGGYEQKNWQVAGKLSPSFYDFKDNGEEAPPTITTRSEPSKIFNGVPMLSEDAWKRYKAVTSNEIKLDAQLKEKYKGQLDLHSPEAEELRRIMAYEEVEKMKPPIIKSKIEKADPIRYIGGSTTTNIYGEKPVRPIDLTEYKPAGANSKDITPLMQGIDVVSLVTGKQFTANKVVFNHETKRITVTDPVSNKPEEMSLTTFLQNIRPLNAQANTKALEGLRNAITGGNNTQQPTKKEIKRSDIPTKAAAAGYSVKEYEALLIKNGVTIKD